MGRSVRRSVGRSVGGSVGTRAIGPMSRSIPSLGVECQPSDLSEMENLIITVLWISIHTLAHTALASIGRPRKWYKRLPCCSRNDYEKIWNIELARGVLKKKGTMLHGANREGDYIKVEAFSDDGRVGKVKVAVDELRKGIVEKNTENNYGKLVVKFEIEQTGLNKQTDSGSPLVPPLSPTTLPVPPVEVPAAKVMVEELTDTILGPVKPVYLSIEDRRAIRN